MGQCCNSDSGTGDVIEAYQGEVPAYQAAYAPPAYQAPVKQDTYNAPPPVMEEPQALPAPDVIQEDYQEELPLAAPMPFEPEPEQAEAPAPAPEAPEPPEQKVVLTFEVNGENARVIIREAPLGLSFSNETPLKVMKVNPAGSGAKAGVKEGWVFVKVGATSIRDLDYAGAVAELKKGVEHLPKIHSAGAFVVTFLTPDGGKKEVAFTRRPIEMTFDSKMPITVKKLTPGGQAERLGIQVGWQIQAANGKDLTKVDFKTFMEHVKESTKSLPGPN